MSNAKKKIKINFKDNKCILVQFTKYWWSIYEKTHMGKWRSRRKEEEPKETHTHLHKITLPKNRKIIDKRNAKKKSHTQWTQKLQLQLHSKICISFRTTFFLTIFSTFKMTIFRQTKRMNGIEYMKCMTCSCSSSRLSLRCIFVLFLPITFLFTPLSAHQFKPNWIAWDLRAPSDPVRGYRYCEAFWGLN